MGGRADSDRRLALLPCSCGVSFSSMMTASPSSLALLYPKRAAYSPFSSSHSMRPRFRFSMPFVRANFSHVVSALGWGSGLARGRRVMGGGRETRRPGSWGRAVVGREKMRLSSS